MEKLDFLIVGSGLFGAVFARQATDDGKKCLVLEKRPHIAGNIYSEKKNGIDVHMYGPHIFNTNSEKIWNYVQQFADFNDYRHQVLSLVEDRYYNFPLSIVTLRQLWGDYNDEYLIEKFNNQKRKPKSDNLEDWAISQVGEEIYQKFIYGYTKKHWGKEPKLLPSSIIRRIPIRTNEDTSYHSSIFSGIPMDGYTSMVENMLDGIEVATEENYLEKREYWDDICDKVVYTGSIDEFFDYQYGELEWRSLRFENITAPVARYQPVAQVNFPSLDFEKTRTIEHKHFNPKNIQHTILTHEYPQKYKRGLEKYYPVNDEINNHKYNKYKNIITDKYIFGGRLASYKYYDMDQVIGSAISSYKKLSGK